MPSLKKNRNQTRRLAESDPNWWDHAYEDPMIVGSMFAWKRKGTELEVDQLIKRLRLRPGMKILDLACGQGRHSLEFASRGFEVVGLDYSDLLLTQANRASRVLPRGRRPRFVHGDMREADRVLRDELGTFDGVVSLWNAWGYFAKRSDDSRALRAVSRLLKPGHGRFVLNTLNLSGVLHVANAGVRRRWLVESEDRLFLDEFLYDPRRRKAVAHWLWLSRKRGLLKELKFEQNVYSPEDYARQFRKVGLREADLWGRLDGERYTPESWHLTIVGKREA